MQNINVETHIGADGILHLNVPVPVKNTDLKVTLTWQATASESTYSVKQRLKKQFASVSKQVSLADELITERREESKQDNAI